MSGERQRGIDLDTKSLLNEISQTRLAIELTRLGARLQVLEVETTLSRDRLTRLYKELCGMSPPKGMLPYSADWFVTWLPNIHSSLFYSAYRFISKESQSTRIGAIISAYRVYREHVSLCESESVLGFTRAWTLVRFIEAGILQLTRCTGCGAAFVTHAHQPAGTFVCGLCRPPSRAGKKLRARTAEDEK